MRRPWWAPSRRLLEPGWSNVLVLLDPETRGRWEDVIRLAAGITSAGSILDVLAPVLIPLSTPIGAPPGEETDHVALLLERVERLAGRHGVRVRAHLARGRSLRGMLREVIHATAPEVVVLHCPPPRCWELVPELGTALPVIVPDIAGEGHG